MIPLPMVSSDQKSNIASHFNFLDLKNAVVWLMMPSASFDTNKCQWHHMIKKSCVTPFWLSSPKECLGAFQMSLASFDVNTDAHCITWLSWAEKCSCSIDNTINITWCQCEHQMYHLTIKVMLQLILTKQMQWCHWWYHWHHMIPMLVPVALTWQKCHVASHFHHYDLTNAMVPLITLFASCDTDKSIHGITKPKELCYTLFQSSGPNELIGAIDNAIDIIWCWCQCLKGQMTEKVMLHLILVILN